MIKDILQISVIIVLVAAVISGLRVAFDESQDAGYWFYFIESVISGFTLLLLVIVYQLYKIKKEQ